MRRARLLGIAALGIAVLTAATLAADRYGGVSTQPNGAWTGCGNTARPAAVQVRRTAGLAGSIQGILLATERRAPVARGLYYDMCVIVGHPAHLPPNATISCPADFGLSYNGVFYTRSGTLAVFSYGASGCSSLSLSVGTDRADTLIWSNAALAAQTSLDTGLANVFGVRVDAIHQYTFPRHKPPTAAEVRQFFQGLGTAKCMRLHGYPHWLDSIPHGGLPVPAGMGTGPPRLQAAARACGVLP